LFDRNGMLNISRYFMGADGALFEPALEMN
jgi:hypothetical protein